MGTVVTTCLYRLAPWSHRQFPGAPKDCVQAYFGGYMSYPWPVWDHSLHRRVGLLGLHRAALYYSHEIASSPPSNKYAAPGLGRWPWVPALGFFRLLLQQSPSLYGAAWPPVRAWTTLSREHTSHQPCAEHHTPAWGQGLWALKLDTRVTRVPRRGRCRLELSMQSGRGVWV